MYHMGGLAPVLRSALYGTPVVIQREFGGEPTARVLEEYDVTGVSLVPTMCKRLLEAGWEPADTLRFVLLGGAPASSELLERCRTADVPVHPTYGMTETASQIATATPTEIDTYEGTVGQPLLFTDVSVVDETGTTVGPDEEGELVVGTDGDAGLSRRGEHRVRVRRARITHWRCRLSRRGRTTVDPQSP